MTIIMKKIYYPLIINTLIFKIFHQNSNALARFDNDKGFLSLQSGSTQLKYRLIY